MMTVLNQSLFLRQKEASSLEKRSLVCDLWLPMLLFGSMGAITWAIRGTAGWGGVDGTVVPGLMWGVLWYYICLRRGIDARGLVFWLGMGIALGGELGYGQYTGWILGRFSFGSEILPISPATGYLWFFICGIGWAAPGSILLGWALGGKATTLQWTVRSVLAVALLLFLFAWPFVDLMASQLVRLWPGLLFPNAGLGIYSGKLDDHLARTVYTNTQNFAVLVWWIAALIIAAIQRDRTTMVAGFLIGGGFGFGFLQSALWCLGYGANPAYIDWWKMWELNAGFNLGILYALVLFWAKRQLEAKNRISDFGKSESETLLPKTKTREWIETLFPAAAGGVLLFFMGFEYFFWTGIFLASIFFVGMILSGAPRASHDSFMLSEKRKSFALVYSVFLLVFLIFHGGSERAGILLELYNEDAVSQYAWPAARMMLFAPFAIIICFAAFFKILRIIWSHKTSEPQISKISDRMIDLMTIIGFIGALSIWPAKIGVLYAFFIFTALFAFTRLKRKYSMIDKSLD